MIPKFRAWDKHRNEMNYKVMVGNCDTDDENWTCPIIGLKRDKVGYILMIMTLSCSQQVFVTKKVQKFLKAISYIIKYRKNTPLLSNTTKRKVAGTVTV